MCKVKRIIGWVLIAVLVLAIITAYVYETCKNGPIMLIGLALTMITFFGLGSLIYWLFNCKDGK